MELILISAMTRNRVIGSRDGLPWNIPEEYRHFLSLVRGHPVIFGRKSWEIFGADLSDSPQLVVSRSLDRAPGVEICPSVDAALARARELVRDQPGSREDFDGSSGRQRVFSAGGATIYRQTLPVADALYLSIVKGDYTGDARFPDFDEGDWRIARRDDHAAFEFRIYERRIDRTA